MRTRVNTTWLKQHAFVTLVINRSGVMSWMPGHVSDSDASMMPELEPATSDSSGWTTGSLDEVPDDDMDYEDAVAEQIKFPFVTVTDVLDVVLRVQEINEEAKPGREADWKKTARSYVSLYGDSFAQRVPLHAAPGLPTRAAGLVFGCSDIGDALRQQDV